MTLQGTEQERLSAVSDITIYKPDPDNYINEVEFKAAREVYYMKAKAIHSTVELLINKIV